MNQSQERSEDNLVSLGQVRHDRHPEAKSAHLLEKNTEDIHELLPTLHKQQEAVATRMYEKSAEMRRLFQVLMRLKSGEVVLRSEVFPDSPSASVSKTSTASLPQAKGTEANTQTGGQSAQVLKLSDFGRSYVEPEKLMRNQVQQAYDTCVQQYLELMLEQQDLIGQIQIALRELGYIAADHARIEQRIASDIAQH